MNMRSILTLLLLCSTLLASPTRAQVSVVASIDTIEIFIGEQVHVTVRTTAKEGSLVEYPIMQPRQMITPGIEVLDQTDSATVTIDNGMNVYTRKYRITSFDDSLYYLPPFKVKVNNKEYESKSLALKVLEVPVDTTDFSKFYGPKDVQDNPFRWADWSLVFWLSVVMLLLLLVGYYLYLRLRDNKPIVRSLKIVKRLLPHQKAMKEIERIKAEKMVTAENPKEYYTKLTETLRKYIEERYGFRAMEMTSGEIIEKLTESQDNEALNELRTLFQTADLVKFAKYSTLINENDMNLVSAIDFINRTKLENMPEEKPQAPVLTQEEVRTVKTRRALKAVIFSLCAASVLILIFVAYTIFQLIR